MSDTKQTELTRDEKGRITGGLPPNGFDKNPQNRHNGAWKKEDTARYKLEQMIMLTDSELDKLIDDVNTPAFEKRMAKCIKNSEWKELEGMINQVYGKPQERVEHSNPDGNLMPTVRIVDERNKEA